MQTVLMILGGVLLGALVVLVGGFYALRFWLRRRIEKMAAAGAFQQPLVLHIKPKRLERSFDNAGAMRLVEAARVLGYEDAGFFEVPELEGITLWGGVHPQDSSMAVVYLHAKLPAPWHEFVRAYTDLSFDMVSSTPVHNPKNTPPESVAVVDTQLTPEAARAALIAMPVRKEILHATTSGFPTLLADSYARSMEHIASLGGLEREDIELINQQFNGPSLMKEQVDLTQEVMKAQYQHAFQQVLLDRFLESGQISAKAWHALDGNALAVHEKMSDAEAVVLGLNSSETLDDDAPEVAELIKQHQGAPIALFEAVNALLPEEERQRLLGEIHAPVRARIYTGVEV